MSDHSLSQDPGQHPCGSQPEADVSATAPLAPAEWTEVEVEAAEAMVRGAMPVVRRAADDLYAELLDSVESFLSENVRFNLSVQLRSAKDDAHDMRMRNLALTKRVETLTQALRSAKRELTIPAAEYVPAIPVVWEILDRALATTPEA